MVTVIEVRDELRFPSFEVRLRISLHFHPPLKLGEPEGRPPAIVGFQEGRPEDAKAHSIPA